MSAISGRGAPVRLGVKVWEVGRVVGGESGGITDDVDMLSGDRPRTLLGKAESSCLWMEFWGSEGVTARRPAVSGLRSSNGTSDIGLLSGSSLAL